MEHPADETASVSSQSKPLPYASKGADGAWSRAALFWISPLGYPTLAVAAILALASFWTHRKPAADFLVWLGVAAAWLLLGGWWLSRVVTRAVLVRTRRPPREWYGPGRWRTVAIALVPIAVYGLLRVNAPRRVAFAISRPAMQRLAAQGAAAPPQTRLPNQRVGLYFAEDVLSIPGGVRFIVGDGFLDRVGYAYSPIGPPAPIGEDYYKPIGGGWCEWVESW